MKGMGFRQSNAWLHTWAGLVLGWLLFAVFVTGTISFFRDEVNLWMKPELHGAQPSGDVAMRVIAALPRVAPGATSWVITLPDERNPAVRLQWYDAQSPTATTRGKRAMLDPATGDILAARDTRGADFLYRFHFELHGVPRLAGRWVVGAATMLMLVALLTGIVTHKKIFADFFTFRRRKGQRSWMDVHNVMGVLALPFHLVITYSGLILLAATLLPWAIQTVYQGDTRAAFAELRGDVFRVSELRKAPPPGQAPLTDLQPLIRQAEQRWPDGVASISVAHAGTPGAVVELQAHSSSLLSERGWGERMRFDGVTGAALGAPVPPAMGGAANVYNVATALHMAHFAAPGLRWLLFLSGILGSAMIASGLILWVVKRLPQQRKSGRHAGHKLVECLNVGAIAGLLAATAVYFWANRLLPVGMAGRAAWEVNIFFLAWLAFLLHPWLRTHRQAWKEQCAAIVVLYGASPLLSALGGGHHLAITLPAGNWLLAGVDLSFIAVAMLAAVALWFLRPNAASRPAALGSGRKAAGARTPARAAPARPPAAAAAAGGARFYAGQAGQSTEGTVSR